VRAFGVDTPATTISVAAIAGVTAPVSGATPVESTTAGIGYTGTVTWATSSGAALSGNFAPITTYTATITLTPASGYTLSGVSADFFTVTGTTSDTNTANSGVITAVFPATGYSVGDTGPGGGTIFYVASETFTQTSASGTMCTTSCKYLEVAPSTWQSGGVSVASDLTYQWSTNTSVLTGQDTVTASTEGFSQYEKYNWKIGQGFYNTSVMKVDGETSTAQAKVLAYAGSATAGQWFIPSMNELNELCKYAWGQTTGDLEVACTASSGTLKTETATALGGFVANFYWSSSEDIAADAWGQAFYDGYQGSSNEGDDDKGSTFYVRPVRAF
jgi:Protein of unknown function (DUF1566)